MKEATNPKQLANGEGGCSVKTGLHIGGAQVGGFRNTLGSVASQENGRLNLAGHSGC